MISQSPLRAAIYSRKSTDHGLEKDFNSCDAQEQACEHSIQANGWTCASVYRDGGFSGGNLKRPDFQRLLRDIEAGSIDAVVVHRVDRFSRSLIDFLHTMDTLNQHGVRFISVTQQIDTSTHMGNLILNVLLSFAQFEREMISERTRDKIIAARQRGKFTGGRPILGYDIERSTAGSRLIVNPAEAAHVQAMFSLYLEHKSLIEVARELNQRGWTTKAWTSKNENSQGAKPFDKKKLHGVLTNPLYLGKTRVGKELYDGEHEAIIDTTTWKQVQQQLAKNHRAGGGTVTPVLLRGLLYCAHCGQPMAHTYTIRNKIKYRYYVCNTIQERGKGSCVARRIPAAQIENFIVEQIREIANDPQLCGLAIQAANEELAGEGRINIAAAGEAFREFDPMWDVLSTKEQARILQLLIQQIEYDSSPGKQSATITYHPGVHEMQEA